MTNDQIIRAWKDRYYRSSLTESELAQLPPHPAGGLELTDAQLNAVNGGLNVSVSFGCVPSTMLCNIPTLVNCTYVACSYICHLTAACG